MAGGALPPPPPTTTMPLRKEALTLYTAAACGVSAVGGILFGYDIGVTGGVTADRQFLKNVWEGVEGGMRGEEGLALAPPTPPPLLPPSHQFFPSVYCQAYDCTSELLLLPPKADADPYCKV